MSFDGDVNQERKLRNLAMLARRFRRAADTLVNARTKVLQYPGKRNGERAWKAEADYDRLVAELDAVTGEYV